MHLLFLTSLIPGEDPSTGFEIANRAIVEGFRDAGAQVTVAGLARPGDGAGLAAGGNLVLGEAIVENAEAGIARKAGWLVAAFRHSLPVPAAKMRAVEEREILARLKAHGPFDAIVLNSLQLPTAYPALTALAPAIFVAHNVEHLSALEYAAMAGSPLSRWLYRREARLLEAAEKRLCREAAFVLTLAEEDLGPLGLAEGSAAAVLPLPIGRSAVPGDSERRYDVGLIGTWTWAPNRVGLDWFLERVVPLLPSDFRVAIAGRHPGPPEGAPDNVRFLGRVPDAQAFVRSARVLALATRGGTGVQLKTIEALEEGLACVATSQALRGIARPLPANVALADDPQAFATALTRMVEAERGGDSVRLDGSAFAERQRLGRRTAIQRALGALALPPLRLAS